MSARDGEHDLVAEERLEHDAAVAPRRADDSELQLAARDLLDDSLRVGDGQRDVHVGMPLLELAQHDGDHRPARPGRGAELEASRQLTLDLLAELGEQLLLLREQAQRAPVEAPPGLGRLYPTPRPVEELQAEPLLERTDLQADRRLGDPELLGRL